MPIVRSTLDAGHIPGCEALTTDGGAIVEISLMMPSALGLASHIGDAQRIGGWRATSAMPVPLPAQQGVRRRKPSMRR